MTNSYGQSAPYTAVTPDTVTNTVTTPNVVNAEPLPVISDDQMRNFQALMMSNPDFAAKALKLQEKSESEGASAVRGNVTTAIESAVRAAVEAMTDKDSGSYIEGSREYMVRVGKITTTSEVAADGQLAVATKSPRKKRDGTESTTNA